MVKALDSAIPMTREIVGNRIAEVAGLRTPEPGLIFLDRGIVARVDAARCSAGIFSKQHAGWVSGARQFNATNVLAWVEVTTLLQNEALLLYIFDMLALHSDRVERNPNCAATSGGLMVYDFEQCFSEEPRFVQDCPHWAATTELGSKHMFYTALRGTANVRRTARRVIQAMTDSRLQACLQGLPRGWMEEGKRIATHIQNVRNHSDEFVDDIVRSLRP